MANAMVVPKGQKHNKQSVVYRLWHVEEINKGLRKPERNPVGSRNGTNDMRSDRLAR